MKTPFKLTLLTLGLGALSLAQAGVEFSTKGGLKMKTSDGNFAFQVGGRVMADAAFYDEDATALGDGTELRRARLFAKGVLFHDWAFKGQYDFAGNKTNVKDAYLRYIGFKPTSITVGNFKEPFSLEEQTSSKYITFMERALPNVFSPGRHLGLGLHTHGDAWSAAAGIFGEGVSSDAPEEGDEGWGISGRLTFAPMHEKTQALHLGISAFYREPNDTEEVRFRERPESHVTSVRLVDTGTLDHVDNYTGVALEAALVFGPFSLQGEYMQVDVSRNLGPEPTFDGWYVYGSWFITGESRPYNAKKGAFGRVHPKASKGAWEIGVRYSSLDLSDASIEGGEENNLTVGLNWYATSHVRFMLNYISVDTDPSAKGLNDDPNIIQARAQVDF